MAEAAGALVGQFYRDALGVKDGASPSACSRPSTAHTPACANDRADTTATRKGAAEPGGERHGKTNRPSSHFTPHFLPHAHLCLLKSNSPLTTQPDLTSSRKPCPVACWQHSLLCDPYSFISVSLSQQVGHTSAFVAIHIQSLFYDADLLENRHFICSFWSLPTLDLICNTWNHPNKNFD